MILTTADNFSGARAREPNTTCRRTRMWRAEAQAETGMIASYQIARDRANLEGGWGRTYRRSSEG
jgi:hypothetical protein